MPTSGTLNDHTSKEGISFCRRFRVGIRSFSDRWNLTLSKREDGSRGGRRTSMRGTPWCFTGAMGSIDATHIAWVRAPFSHALSYTGKDKYSTLAYEVIVDHSGRILAATKGYPGAHNESIVHLDEAVGRARMQAQSKSVEYNMFKADGASRKLRLLRLICDGGYYEWNSLLSTIKARKDPEGGRFSRALESVRKDVECRFGILKGHFRALKLPISLHKSESVDNMFFTCFAIHNILHAYYDRQLHEEGTG